MGRKRTGWVRKKDGTWYVGLTLRSGKAFEKPVPAPPDGLPVDDNYLELVRIQLVRAYDAGAWDPEAPAPLAVPVVPMADQTFLEHVRAFVARVAPDVDLAYPIVHGTPGHPVIWSPKARTRIPNLRDDEPPARVRRDPALRIAEMLEHDDAYITDVDTPAAWAAAEARALARER